MMMMMMMTMTMIVTILSFSLVRRGHNVMTTRRLPDVARTGR